MRKGIGITAAVAAGLLLSSLNASALVLTEKSEAQKLRAGIQKQTHGYTSCLVKAATNCEKSSTLPSADCTLATGAATNGGDAKGKFVGDIAKCDGKLDFLKGAKTLTASTGYTAIGCPGDSNGGTAGDQPYADLSAWQAGTPASTKPQIDALATLLSAFGECGMNADPLKCQATLNKTIAGYAAAIQKCQLACETDYKNKKGDGGNDDSTTACSLNAGATAGVGDANFNACIDKAYAKATKTPLPMNVAGFVLTQLATALNDANNDINNENDCP
ncbi:hypothetical protein K2Z84_30995 [Candidatus Binatia bacterium]|nr:hypothetical protein [Candidatus Binatia bacterium]